MTVTWELCSLPGKVGMPSGLYLPRICDFNNNSVARQDITLGDWAEGKLKIPVNL